LARDWVALTTQIPVSSSEASIRIESSEQNHRIPPPDDVRNIKETMVETRYAGAIT
jgi:hypothetical protein